MPDIFSIFKLADVMAGLNGLMTPNNLMLMVLGVVLSSLVAAAPGIGSLLLLSLMLPFAITLEPFGYIALIFGIATVGNTASTFSSVLIGVPGSAGSQATILDGFPMAKRGEANRAFGAAFMGSLLGAFIGALTFIISLPVFAPLVLSIGSPQFLMLVLWGLSAVSVLGGSQPVKGLISAIVGLSIALIGTDARTGVERFTFGSAYLWDGVALVIIAMGIFAVPEMVDMARRKSSISDVPPLGRGIWQGILDAFRHWWLVVRCSIVGVWVGALPGLGSSVADWFAYAHALQTEKNPEKFGTGDVRGVIAPESANNAKEGGDLIPTLLFGIPGGSSMAIILVGMIAVGIQPGSQILTAQAPYLFATVWTLVIANIMATLLALAFAPQFARACMVQFYYLVPAVFLFCCVGAFGHTLDFNDLIALLVFGAIGVLMKKYGWPRPPLLVAVVLGPQVQQYLWLSVDLYGYEWLTFPSVLALALLVLGTIALPFLRRRRGDRMQKMEMDIVPELARMHERGSLVMGAVLGLVFGGMIWLAFQWPMRASISVFFIAGAGLLLVALQAGRDVLALARHGDARPASYSFAENFVEFTVWLWLAGLVLSCYLVGFHISFALYPFAYGLAHRAGWRGMLILSVCSVGLLWLVFDYLLGAIWPEPLLLPFLYQ
ncbi:MAG: hypothetical protein RLZ98_589 [Pseudomonadota bacterium]